MSAKEAKARIKINKLLEDAGWRFFDSADGPANIQLRFDVKRKINTLRDILVGKVPDPKAQVEQITIALIYKFMDDQDLQAVEFGGKRKFFTGEYEKYAYSQIMLPENSAQDRLNLYAEGIEKMTTNGDLPKLFRDILRNAYIPYRDPETLNRFLKEIMEFSYEDSEDLGNAFEYLLSIMGSQGDAGQFRTPRHIIDMMVEITQPKKNESILDIKTPRLIQFNYSYSRFAA